MISRATFACDETKAKARRALPLPVRQEEKDLRTSLGVPQMPMSLTSLARGMRRRQTNAEVRLWSRLRNRHLGNLKFRRQVPRGKFIADFLCDEAMLILEVDGSQHGDRTAEDERPTVYLESLGYLVLRFWNFDVLQNTDRVLDHIHEVGVARRKAPSSAPSGPLLPKGRRGVGTRASESDAS